MDLALSAWAYRHSPLSEKSGTTITAYVYAGGNLKAKLVGTTTYHYISDPIGSTWQVWKQGTTNNPYFSVKNYRPFGTPNSPSGTEKVKFVGEIQDSSTGLYYIFARYYDPELGRFISLDPQLGKLSSPQTLECYVYCINNPLRFTDPTGELFGIKLPKISLQTIVLVAVCVAVTVSTGGLGGGIAGAILIGALTGAATNVGMYTAFTALEGGKLTIQGFASAAVSGAISGAVGAISGGVGSGFIRIGGSIGTQIAGSTIARLGAAAGIGALGGVASYVAGEGTKMAMTGGKEGSITGRGLLLGAAFGSAGGFSAGALRNYGLKPGFPDYAAMPSYSEAVKQAAPSILYTGITGFLGKISRPWAVNGDIGLAVRVSTIPSFQG